MRVMGIGCFCWACPISVCDGSDYTTLNYIVLLCGPTLFLCIHIMVHYRNLSYATSFLVLDRRRSERKELLRRPACMSLVLVSLNFYSCSSYKTRQVTCFMLGSINCSSSSENVRKGLDCCSFRPMQFTLQCNVSLRSSKGTLIINGISNRKVRQGMREIETGCAEQNESDTRLNKKSTRSTYLRGGDRPRVQVCLRESPPDPA